MQPENRYSNSYWRRMLIIQKWRRITLVKLPVPMPYALAISSFDPDFHNPSTLMLVGSLAAFFVAAIVAVNFFTVALGFRRRRKGQQASSHGDDLRWMHQVGLSPAGRDWAARPDHQSGPANRRRCSARCSRLGCQAGVAGVIGRWGGGDPLHFS
jgi:hypothetical protein